VSEENGKVRGTTTGAADHGMPENELLTAYLDGELGAEARAALERRLAAEPALKARLDGLASATDGLAAAYQALSAVAPRERLETFVARATVLRRPRWLPGRAALSMAAAIVVFILGAVVARLIPLAPVHGDLNWRQAVAEYQGFTNTETLAAIPDVPQVLDTELKTISGRLAVSLSPDKLTLPDATLKRADLFTFGGRPLVQLAYLTAGEGPVAFCIIPSDKPDATAQFETRDGFNVVFWNDDGRAYMLIGAAPRATLERYAGLLQARV
jgi:anti-sigma factor RsiW